MNTPIRVPPFTSALVLSVTSMMNSASVSIMCWRMVSSTLERLSRRSTKAPGDIHGTQVVRVGDKEILFALVDELVKNARVKKGIVEITMAGGVPVALVIVGAFRAWKEGLLVDTGVTRLVERGNADLLVGVLLDDAESIVMGVERGHEDEGHVDTAGRVEVLNLADSEIEESHVVLDLEGTLRAGHTHRCTETAVDLEDGEFVETGGIFWSNEVGIGYDLVCSGRLDAVPVTSGMSGSNVGKREKIAYRSTLLARSERYRVKRKKKDCISVSKACRASSGRPGCRGETQTFFVRGSSTVETRREISLRMALAATPVVAVLKSM